MKTADKYSYKAVMRLIGICLFFFFSCKDQLPKKQVENAFYFWKSVFEIPSSEQALMDSLHVKTLYVKYFDVDWDDDLYMPVPKASLRVSERYNGKQRIVPCVFITNECIQRLDSLQVEQLAGNIMKLVKQINESLEIKIPELQLDCDWTAKTTKVYFTLLESIRAKMKADTSTTSAKLSCTIRLYQVKYLQKTGVPPVDRGMLMAYNMGNLRDPKTYNSILEANELRKYISYLSDYPLDLDVALPIFEWIVLFRNNNFNGLIQKLPENIFSDKGFKKIKDNRYQVIRDTTVIGYNLTAGDILRLERSETSEILDAAKDIRKRLQTSHLTLSLFHLDSLTLRKYKVHELQSLFRSLN